jgi:hypothetical protein
MVPKVKCDIGGCDIVGNIGESTRDNEGKIIMGDEAN